jgi:hypothetical protein
VIVRGIFSLAISFLVLVSVDTQAQQYGHEWIRFSQEYFKIPVSKNGVYRLTYENLIASGFPSNADYTRIQLFHKGTEQSIWIEKLNPANPALAAGDFIEFYGVQNSGVSDIQLYQPSSTQPHQFYNLFSDTTSYFLTVNTQGDLGLRMSNFSESVPTVPADQFHSDEKIQVFASEYATGQRYNESSSTYVQKSAFETGEGWTGQGIAEGQSLPYVIEGITFPATTQGNPTAEIQLVGRTKGAHPYEISVGPSSPTRVVASGSFSDYNVETINVSLNWSDIGGDGKISIRVSALASGITAFRLSASYIKINFPQQFNMSGVSEKVFTLTARAASKAFIQIQNPPSGNVRLFDITNPQHPSRIGSTLTTSLNAVINETTVSRKILVTNTFTTPTVKRVVFRSVDPILHNYLIISHKLLMRPAGGFANPVKEYASYRSSSEGGAYDTLVIDINQLYNQFNYGEVSPLAIRRFLNYMVDKGSPKYLFIIGKGLEVKFDYHRNPDNTSLNGFHSLVPPAGDPASDILYSVGLGNSDFEPAIPTGRISASTPKQVVDYLLKVKEIEATSYDALWRKNVLHLSGGLNTIEQGQFKFFLEYLGQKAEDFYLGGNVTAIAKNSTDIEFINISDKINEGVNLVTMFGHSGSSTGEFNVGYASAPELGYTNKGKYPMFLANGCNAGDFFSQAIRWPEDWVFTADKGAIAFMANTGFGFTEVLNYYSNTLYTVAYRDLPFFEKGIGDIQKEVVKRMINGLNAESDTVRYLSQAHQMFLLGDPATKIFGASRPDYEINDNSVEEVSLLNNQITTVSDSFAINIIVRNFGRAEQDSVHVRVTRTFGDNILITYDSTFASVLYTDTLVFVIYRAEDSGGENHFKIEIDPDNETVEFNELNNTAEFTFQIPSNAPTNLYPENFAIVNTETIKLTSQSFNVLDESRDFIMELDTVPSFDSQFLKQEIVFGKIATKEFDLITGVDTLAYYWRSKFLVDKPNESTDWATSSFTYIMDGPEGWAQVHFPQFLSNTSESISLNAEEQKFQFVESVTDVSINSFGSLAVGYDTIVQFGTSKIFHPELSVKVGGTEFHALSLIQDDSNTPCVINTLNCVSFSKTSTRPYILPGFQSTVLACGRRPEIIASFTASNIETHLASYVDNIAVGDSVVLFTVGNPGVGSWSGAVKNKLNELGISNEQINSLEPGEPIIIFAKKGATPGGSIIHQTDIIPAAGQSLEINRTITGRSTSGILGSTVIGPAVEWQSFYAKTEISELPQTDEFSFDIIGIMLTGEENVFRSGITNLTEDLSDIDASEYPYLRINYRVKDEINLTPPQLKKWVVAYTPAAEGVIVYNGTFEQQVMNEGEVWSGDFSFQNISEKEFTGPLKVQYTVNNTTQRKTFVDEQEIAAPLPGQKTDFTVEVNTIEKVGLNNVKVVVNPRIIPELYFDNNMAELKSILNVEGDEISPVLDVTIDGRYVQNGDYVSANPVICFQLWDENDFIFKTDTLDVKIFLNNSQIFFKKNPIEWSPATSTIPFMAAFIPPTLAAGDYTLRIDASDARKNVVTYQVIFIVAEDETIKISKPYPNPSTASFFFDITIAGGLQPDAAYLQLINLTGGVVGEFRVTEFYTGTNTIVWNSSDTNGNQLPNGLYVYRLIVSQGGKQLKAAAGKILLSR